MKNREQKFAGDQKRFSEEIRIQLRYRRRKEKQRGSGQKRCVRCLPEGTAGVKKKEKRRVNFGRVVGEALRRRGPRVRDNGFFSANDRSGRGWTGWEGRRSVSAFT